MDSDCLLKSYGLEGRHDLLCVTHVPSCVWVLSWLTKYSIPEGCTSVIFFLSDQMLVFLIIFVVIVFIIKNYFIFELI